MSNKNLKSTGVILRKVNLNEGDRIVTLLTADRGKVHAIAKGARQFKSKFCGKLEPFNHLAFTGFQGRELIYLNEVELLNTFCERTAEHGPLFYLAEVTHKLMQDDEHVDGVYELLVTALDLVQQPKPARLVLVGYLVQLLGLIGFTSPWQHCAICHDRLSGEGEFWMSDEHLNVVCTHCKQPADEPVPFDLVKWVAFIQANPLAHSLTICPTDVQFQQVWNWLQRTLNQLLSSEVKSGAFLGFSKM